jgi:uncharacterized protein (DUF2384 family)
MGRTGKVTSRPGRATAKISGVERREHSKRLQALNTDIVVNRAHRRGGKISRDSVAAHALATFGSPEKATHWMNRPNPLFQGKTPAQVIEFDLLGVEAELVRIDHGIYM